MPATARQTSRTGLPGSRSEISFRWTPNAIKQLLELVKNTPDYRATFFHKGLTVRKKSGIARELLLDLVKDEPDYLAFLRVRGMIKKDETGRWVPLDTWTSAFNNPASSKLHDLKRTYAKARNEYKIKSYWTKFADLPSNIRRDFLGLYPWYFIYKELDSPTQPFERPPLRIPDRPPATIQNPASETTRPVVRRRRHELPSPSPSDHSTPEPPPSPSNRSTPEPSLPPEPTSSRSFLNLTPTIAAPPTRTTSSFTLGVRPYLRPNAVASSSQIPIEIDTSSSSSSSSSSESDSESEHEMETYTPEMPPPRSPSPPADVDWLGNGRFPAPSRSVSVGSKSNRTQTPSSARACQAGPSRRLLPQSDSDSESDSSIDLDPAPVPEVKTEASEPYVAHVDKEETERKPDISYTEAREPERRTNSDISTSGLDKRRQRGTSLTEESREARPAKRSRPEKSPIASGLSNSDLSEHQEDAPGLLEEHTQCDQPTTPADIYPAQEEKIATGLEFRCPCCESGEAKRAIGDRECEKVNRIRGLFHSATRRLFASTETAILSHRIKELLELAPGKHIEYAAALGSAKRLRIVQEIQHRLLVATLQDLLFLDVIPRGSLSDCMLSFRMSDTGAVSRASSQVLRQVAEQAGATLCDDKWPTETDSIDMKRIAIEDTLSRIVNDRHVGKDKFLPGSIQSMGHLDFGRYLFDRLVRDQMRPREDAIDQMDQDLRLPANSASVSDRTSVDALALSQRDSTNFAASATRDKLMDEMRQAVGPDIPVWSLSVDVTPKSWAEYQKAKTEGDRRDALTRSRAWMMNTALLQMRKRGLLPERLADCRLWFDCVPVFKDSRKYMKTAGATLCQTEEKLIEGAQDLIRIHIRKDLDGLDVDGDLLVFKRPAAEGMGSQGPLVVRQYSYLAFGRFLYNRLCIEFEGDYEPLPSLARG